MRTILTRAFSFQDISSAGAVARAEPASCVTALSRVSKVSKSHGGGGVGRQLQQQRAADFLTRARSHLDAKWSTVHIPSLTSPLPITTAGAARCCDCCVVISASGPGGPAAWAENAWSNVLWWHLRRDIAAACRAANLSEAFLQDLHERMHGRCGTRVDMLPSLVISPISNGSDILEITAWCSSQVCTGFPLFNRTPLKFGTLDTNYLKRLFARSDAPLTTTPAGLWSALAQWFSLRSLCCCALRTPLRRYRMMWQSCGA
jgi:hypothetical protein